METDFAEVTEIAGEPISAEQLYRLNHRYTWATTYLAGRDGVEVGCGTGPGLGLLAAAARSLEAGDVSPLMVETARRHYASRIRVSRFDAQSLPFADRCKDVILLFEAIYYIPDATRFIAECARVLRPRGAVLIVTANKDLWDFHPSPYTHRYYGVRELDELFDKHGFDSEFFGFQDASHSSVRQRVLRPVKRLAVMSGLMPKTMAGKRWLKRIVFGAEVSMPAELSAQAKDRYVPPQPLARGQADRRHKIIYAAARLRV
jgi:SAM-dependent methyltransferase